MYSYSEITKNKWQYENKQQSAKLLAKKQRNKDEKRRIMRNHHVYFLISQMYCFLAYIALRDEKNENNKLYQDLVFQVSILTTNDPENIEASRLNDLLEEIKRFYIHA